MTVSEPLRRLIYVDDDRDIRGLAKLALSIDTGIDVRTCSSGAELLEATASVPPDLILLDVMMPDLDGPATLAKLREQAALASIPVVFVTARALSSEVERLRALGAADVISKPFDPRTLLQQIRSIWARLHD
jgi:two-component system OmpR family response regulator